MSRTACRRRAMKKEEENGSAEKSPCQSTLQTTMPPLGLGLGSGLGIQHGQAIKSTTSTAAAAMAFMESRARGVNARDEKGRTALHFACGMASGECARLLLEAGADVEIRDKDGFTAMHMAAGYGRGHCVELLLKHGASVLCRERTGRTPRELALEIRDGVSQGQDMLKIPRGDIETAIQRLADAEVKEQESNAAREKARKVSEKRAKAEKLGDAAALGHLEESSLSKDNRSTSAIPKKVLCPKTLGSALSVACRGGHVDVAELLLSSGAEVDAHDPDGATPLLAAADSGSAKCVQLLLKHGAQADLKDRVGVTALIAAAYNGHTECLKVLLSHGAAVDSRSHGGVTPLIAAAEGRNAPCTQVLIQAGAQVDAKTSEGKTALMHSVSRNCIEATKALLVGGADVNAADGDGCTALHHGARNNSIDCLRILLEKDADVTRKCRRGRTPLQEAPKGSLAAKLLDERWKQLELEVALRQEELLNLFAQDTSESKSTSKKSSTRQARLKKKGKRKKESVQKNETGRQELTRVITKESKSVDTCSSSESEAEVSTLEVDMDQVPVSPSVRPEEDIAAQKSLNACNGGASEGNNSLWGSPKTERQVSEGFTSDTASGISSPGGTGRVSPAEDGSDNRDNWIKVDGKGSHQHHPRLISPAASVKPQDSQARPQGGLNGLLSLESLKTVDSLGGDNAADRKMNIAQRNKQTEGRTKSLKENEVTESNSLPWVQAGHSRNCSAGDGIDMTPHIKTDMRTSLSEAKAEDTWKAVLVETPPETMVNTEENLSNRVQRIEQELERTQQAACVDKKKVRELELLVSARGLGNVGTNSWQVAELTHALDIQVLARVHAETAKAEMEVCIRDLKALVATQGKALEAARAEIAELKLQKLQSEEQHKQQCKLQHKEAVAAGCMEAVAAAATWRAWEIQHTRDSLQGWSPECGDTSTGESAPSLHRTRKLNQGPLAPDSLFLPKEEGEQGEQKNTELKSAATDAAVAAASLLGGKNDICSSLKTNTQDLTSTNSAPESISKSASSASSWDEGNLKEETHDIPAGQVSVKVGKGLGPGLMRSASEGSLHLMESGTEQQQQQQNLLPFIPMAGPRTDPVNGWFSLVPSPVD